MGRKVAVGGALTFTSGLGMGLLEGTWSMIHAVAVAAAVGTFAAWVHRPRLKG